MHPGLPGHLNNTTSHFLSLPPLFLEVSLSLNKFFSLSISITTTTVWREGVRIRPKCRIMLAKPWLPASHAGSTAEIKCAKRREEKTTKQNPLHFIRLSLPFSLCVQRVKKDCWKDVKKQEETDRKGQTVILALPRLSHYNVHGW